MTLEDQAENTVTNLGQAHNRLIKQFGATDRELVALRQLTTELVFRAALVGCRLQGILDRTNTDDGCARAEIQSLTDCVRQLTALDKARSCSEEVAQ